ncbi:MAG TPA: hypothetical protein ENG95_00605 [Nitrospirae bacterium]|nr:hypothetical protein BMS3Abin10_00434 [bacterium BMS3Abin10]GBE37615.1 hypothetical protein BMS3Bbin08_00205 [bacterium BMS3Bbin08]HDH50418.1 hypothetical protein [Nitrospirota bacterium]HDK81132.1 hypothetical protein [Nitrospirota bacterium]HDO25126.1 hypothetical protein [Nitrospirota bacterium]
MEKRYNHINMNEREVIAKMHWEGKRVVEIARALGRNKGTISRELKRNSSAQYKCYTPCRAQNRSEQRRQAISRRPRLKNGAIRQYVKDKLALGWSPELTAL